MFGHFMLSFLIDAFSQFRLVVFLHVVFLLVHYRLVTLGVRTIQWHTNRV